jgi:hypothetical protein
MTADQPTPADDAPEPSAEPGAKQRKGPPAWGIVLFLVLLGAMAMLNQWFTTSGPEIAWINGGVDDALAEAPADGRVFLYLYEPDDPVHTRNERNVFAMRWAREPLVNAVCVRVPLREDDIEAVRLRRKYGYRGSPLMLLLKPDGREMGRVDGTVDERAFYTQIGAPLRRLESDESEE